jgi:hypothetical protein
MPITMAPIGTSAQIRAHVAELGCNQRARGMPIANTARQTVTTPSVPPTPP